MKNIDALSSGWLGDTSAQFRDAILSVGRLIPFSGGTAVYNLGADDQDLFGVASGAARMHIAMNEHEQRVAHICGPGFWFGEFELITGASRILEIDVPVDSVLFRVRKSDFLQITKTDPEAWKWIAQLSAEHTAIALGAADDLMLETAENRLTAVLLRLCGHRLAHPASPPMDSVLMTQSELAVAANMSRRSAGRILRELETIGAISIQYGSIYILVPEMLAARLKSGN